MCVMPRTVRGALEELAQGYCTASIDRELLRTPPKLLGELPTVVRSLALGC